jgi:RNA polymerase sigma-70 factor (ECF subfamily)
VTTQTNKQDFTNLIQENKRIIFKICNTYCTNKNDRDDLAQEIVYELWRSYKNFDAQYKFTTWMYRVALNVAISFYRKEKKAIGTIVLNETLIDVEDQSEISEETETNFTLMHAFIAELKVIDKSIMLLYLDSKSYREIAEITGLTETNVATRINRIKGNLKNQFSKHNTSTYGTK